MPWVQCLFVASGQVLIKSVGRNIGENQLVQGECIILQLLYGAVQMQRPGGRTGRKAQGTGALVFRYRGEACDVIGLTKQPNYLFLRCEQLRRIQCRFGAVPFGNIVGSLCFAQ